NSPIRLPKAFRSASQRCCESSTRWTWAARSVFRTASICLSVLRNEAASADGSASSASLCENVLASAEKSGLVQPATNGEELVIRRDRAPLGSGYPKAA